MNSPPPRLPDPEPTPVPPPNRWGIWPQRTLGLLVSSILLGHLVDLQLMGHFDARSLGLRLLWCLSLPLVGLPGARPRERRVRYVGILLFSLCVLGLISLVGGVTGVYFLILPLLPVGMAILTLAERDRTSTFLCGGVCWVGTLLLELMEDTSWVGSAVRLMVVGGTTLLGDFLTRGALNAMHAEHQVLMERARRESLEALALSEHRRARSEQLATVGQLAAGVAHEINNPLAYVGSNVDFVRDELTAQRPVDREQLAQVLDETRAGVQHIRQIVADLRGFARMDEQEPTPCALVDVVADALKLGSLRLKHVTWLRVDVPVELPEVLVVRQRLVQVLLNLFINAGDALEQHVGSERELRVTGQAGPGRVVLLIEDNGPGFAPHVLARLFEAFVTTKSVDKGTGLGLNLSRELVIQLGGTLTASNRPEGGARLRLELPARPSLPDAMTS